MGGEGSWTMIARTVRVGEGSRCERGLLKGGYGKSRFETGKYCFEGARFTSSFGGRWLFEKSQIEEN